MNRIVTLLLLLCLAGAARAQDSVEKRIILIGDAGVLVDGKAKVIDAVRKRIPLDKNTIVIYLGDNLYTQGLPDEQYANYNDAKRVLDSQAGLVKGTEAKAYFIPGNHDWANGKPRGFESILRQQEYIDRISADNVKFFPEGGCPGPVDIKISENVILIIMDSQWWIHRNEKPGIESDCDYKTKEEVLSGLKDIVDKNPRKLIVFACHHPFRSTGVHSGYFSLKQHLFPFTDLYKYAYIPLPVLGSIYPISRSVFGSPQDLKYPAYANMISDIDNVLKTHPYVIHVSGHEHNLQLLNDSNSHYVISGAGSKTQRVAKSRKTQFVSPNRGFAVMEVKKSRDVDIQFYEVDLQTDTASESYSGRILNFSKFPPLEGDSLTVHDYPYHDSADVIINPEYAKAGGIKRAILGDNYRTEWNTAVRMKVFNIKKEEGGFKIDGLGGGKQSRSLHLTDSKGRRWNLRTLNKSVEKVIPQNFRNSFAGDVVQDMVSASNPYGALPVPALSEALGVVHPTPQYFFVPDDYALGYYRPLFANTVCMLELAEPTYDNSNAKSTFKLFNKMISEGDHVVDQKAVLRARMLDFLLADFDRHADQWKWGAIDTGKGKLYYPIPRDRDQAFFYSDGLLVKYLSRRLMPFIKGFRYDLPKSNYLGFVARDFDRVFLNQLNEDDWREELTLMQRRLDDKTIAGSMRALPPEIRGLDSQRLAAKFESRRDKIGRKGLLYYRFLSRRVAVLGTNDDEYFRISGSGNNLLLNVYTRNKKGDTNFRMYSRSFDPRVTKELRMYGFNGNDVFTVDPDVNSRIRLRVIGGQGEDTFRMNGHVRNHLYDLKNGENKVEASRKSREHFSNSPDVNEYNYKSFNYDLFRFPLIRLGVNSEDGILVGAGITARTYEFRKAPFGTFQRGGFLYSLSQHAFQADYTGVFNDVYRKLDLVAEARIVKPALDNFFGFGNETVNEESSKEILYYHRVRYNRAFGTVELQKKLFDGKLSIGAGPYIYHYWNNPEDAQGRILEHPQNIGLDSASVFTAKSYLGGRFSINVDNLNDDLFPTRGVLWNNDLTVLGGIDQNSKSLSKVESNMAVYASLSDPARVVAVLRFGGGRILSRQFEYFQALTLGGSDYLRGYRKQRFSGSSMAYSNVELRVKLADISSYILPGSLGVVGFYDVGRVWLDNEHSDTWHHGVGGGLYYTPFNYVILSGTLAHSPDGTLFNISLGTKFNLLF